MYAKTISIGFASWAVLLLLVVAQVTAQPYTYIWDGTSTPATTFWDTNANWNVGTSGRFNNASPRAFDQEMGLLDNSILATPYTVNVRLLQDTLGAPAAGHGRNVAGVTLGAAATTGTPPVPVPLPVPVTATLNIQSASSLHVVRTYGPSGALPPNPVTVGTGNATLNDTGAITIQSGGLLSVEDILTVNGGTLNVLPGGQASTRTLISAARGTITLAGNASLTSTASSTLNGITNISGPSVVFATPSISMASTSVFSPDVTSPAVAAGTGHSVINVSGGVSVNGTIRPQFHNGVVPQLGDTWTLWDSAQIQGDFTASDATGTGAALPTGLRYALTTTTAGSVHGVKGQLTVENFLTAEVNRANGQVIIRNTDTTVGPGVTITGYQIGSAGGALKPMSFTSAYGGAWETAGLTNNSVGALNPSGSTLVGLGASNSLGNVYDPVRLQTIFGSTPVSDLTFSYSRSDGRTVNAPVTYINTGIANTFVLQVDPTDGKARIINDSVFDDIEFDGYQVTSASDSLLPTWHSLQDQSISGWEEATPTTGSLAELNPLSMTTVDAGQTVATMTGLFKTAGSMQDLAFQFRAAAPTIGAAIGDYNEDGRVNAADYTVWRNSLGQAIALPNEDPSQTPNMVTSEDYGVWKSNFGNTGSATMGSFQIYTGVVRYASFSAGGGSLAATSVPEPSTFLLLCLGGLAVLNTRRGK
jgi:hypothetical protein